MNKIIITGGSGFIGTNAINHYLSKKFIVCNIDKNKPRKKDHNKFWKKIDILNKKKLIDFFIYFKPTLIFHFAAKTDLNGKNLQDYKENTLGVQNVIDAIKSVNSIQYVIFASSMLVCKIGYSPKNKYDFCPNTFYGESKVIAEKYINNSNLKVPWTIVRPTSIWGPWFGEPYKNFFHAIKNNFYFHPKNQKIRRSYGFIFNVIYQLEKIAEGKIKNLIHDTTYLADYEPIELGSWALIISKNFKSSKFKEMPLFCFKFLAVIGDLLKIFGIKNPPMSSFRLNNMLTETIFDLDKLKQNIGECPYSLEKGVTLTCRWMEDNKIQ